MTVFDRPIPMFAKFPFEVIKRLSDRPLRKDTTQEIEDFECFDSAPDLDHWEPAETLQREADWGSESTRL